MRKNNMLRLASVLLVAVLLSTCAISGVFAYYYATADADDSAVVAKWGVKVTATTDAFSQFYTDTKLTENTAEATVAGAAKVVAPGTEGSLADMTVTGSPEVDVKVTKTATLDLTNWTVPTGNANDPETPADESKKEYCPIVFTVNSKTYAMKNIADDVDYEYDTIDQLEAAVVAAILGAGNGDAPEAGVYYFEANTNLANQVLDVDVDWVWAYQPQSKDDTALGDQAAFEDDDIDAAKIVIDVSILVEQVD